MSEQLAAPIPKPAKVVFGQLIKYQRQLTINIMEKSLKFAKDVISTNTSEYAKRNQTNVDVIIKQIMVGKIGEMIDQYWVNEMGFKLEKESDFNVYSAQQKNFSPDLIVSGKEAQAYFNLYQNNINISSKTCFFETGGRSTEYLDGSVTPILPLQHSWVYQKSNGECGGGRDNGNHDIYMFNVVDISSMRVGIYAYIYSEIVEKMFILPFSPKLKKIKLCIMQKTCGNLQGFPCGIEELFSNDYAVGQVTVTAGS